MSERVDEHIYNNHGQANERYGKMIRAALGRGKSVRLHQHKHEEECAGRCVTYTPEETTDE